MSVRTTAEPSDGVIVGEYRLGALLGSGGMGQVYRAHPLAGGDEVAIKILLKEHVENAGVVARFLREARAARVVEHPNVVKVLDIGRDAESRPFIVQELLRGEDLSKLLKVTRKLSPSLALELLVPVVDAMAFAHERGVVHRDLKPGNIFITFVDGKRNPKVLDFGISHLMEADDGTRLTSTGMSLGTPAYMAPEQVMASKEIDARADVWSLGVILYQLVAGRLPFAKAESAGALYVQICTTEAPPLEKTAPGVPREYARIVARCLRPERKDRYPSAAELLVDLRKLQDDPSGVASRVARGGMDRVLVETAEPLRRAGAMHSDMPTQGATSGQGASQSWNGALIAAQIEQSANPRRPLMAPPTPRGIDVARSAPTEMSLPPPPMGSIPLNVAVGLVASTLLVLVPWLGGASALGPAPAVSPVLVLVLAGLLGTAIAVGGVQRKQFSKGHSLAALGFLALALSAGVQAFAATDFPALSAQVTPWATLVAAFGCAGMGVGEAGRARKSRSASRAQVVAAYALLVLSLAVTALLAWRTAASMERPASAASG